MGVQFATATRTIQPRIYVACLAAYNNGRLHGAWIDATQDAWAIWGEVQRMLAASPMAGAEEWAIHDYEGFEGASISESEGFEEVAALAAFIDEHGELGGAALSYFGGDLAEAQEAFADNYHGCHASLADYVQDLTEENTDIPDCLRFYVDWESMGRDAEMSGDLFTIETARDEVHIFASR